MAHFYRFLKALYTVLNLFFILGCNTREEISQEQSKEKNIKIISYKEFNNQIKKDFQFEAYSKFFDFNAIDKSNSDVSIITENITRIQNEGFVTYTLGLRAPSEDKEFYNLVLYVNDKQEIYNSFLLKYKPSKKWLQNTGENFSGKVSMVKDSKFSKLTSAKTTSKKKEMDDCIDDVVVHWTCSNGNPHSPYANESDCNVNNGEHSYVIEIVYGVCPGNGSSGDFDSSTGTPSGTSTSGGGSNTIITAPNTVPYDYELKNFLSGVLNNIERNYYNSNSNIRNYTDQYLIDNNFSGPSQFISKNALEFGYRFQLNFEQFIWAFNHINDSDFLEIQNFLESITDSNLKIWTINFFTQNPTTSWAQFQNWFVDGYSENFKKKISQLSLSEIQGYITINKEIDISPYQEEYIKETNEAFVAFLANGDLDNMTYSQMEYTLNSNCCAGIFLQHLINEKVKAVAANYKLLRKLYPSWSTEKVFWHAAKETIHLFLDIAGTVPIIGEVCDITNGVIYTIEGDAINASLSYAGAIPVAGWGATGAKFAIKTVAGGIPLAMVKNVEGFYVVSRNQQLFRKVLGLVKGDARIAHHIIPFALQTNPVIQKAMLSKNAFMINEALNGIPLSTAVHSGSHQRYTDLILRRLNNIPSKYSPDQVYNEIIDIISDIRTAIKNNPNTHINQVNF